MATSWHNFILEHKVELLTLWMDRVMKLFAGKIAPSSPFSEALALALDVVLERVVESDGEYEQALSEVSRILAVQDMLPSKALSLFLELKTIIKGFSLNGKKRASLSDEQYEAMQTRLEEITLQAFDSYMMHREKIFQLKLDELKRQLFMQLRRAEV